MNYYYNMSSYTCDKCDKEFNKKDHYMNHLMKKNDCNTKIKNILNTFDCKYCEQSFSRNRNLTRHLKICKIKNSDGQLKIIKKQNIYQKDNDVISNQTENNKELKNEIIKLNKKLETIENLIVNNNTHVSANDQHMINIENQTNNIKHQTIINNNIYIINYKDEKLNDEDMSAILNNEDPILCAVEKIHCDENNPKQHNVLINDKTRNNIFVYENEKWNLKNKNQTLTNIYSSTIKKITDKITDKEHDIFEVVNANIPNKYNDAETKNFVDERNYFYKNPSNMKKTALKMNDTIYNNKKTIIETKNKNEVFIKKKNNILKINKKIKKELIDKIIV